MVTVIDRLASAARFAAKTPSRPDATLPECGSCPGHCCKGDMIVLHPDQGDVPALYQTIMVQHPFKPGLVHILAHKPDGDCVYLAEVGGVGRCSIYDHRPVICRTFDCGLSFAKMTRQERRAMIRANLASKDVMDMGRRVQARRAAGKRKEGP